MKQGTFTAKLATQDGRFSLLVFLLSALVVAAVGYTLVFVVSASFSKPDLVLHGKMVLFPKGFNVNAYREVFRNAKIWQGYWNTIVLTVVGTAVNVALTLMAAYPLSRRDLPGGRVLMLMVTFTMYFSGGLVPTYLLVRDLGIVDTVWSLILPGAIATYNLIVTRTFFQSSIPAELYEAAEIDGCGNTQMLWRIVLPLSSAIIAILVLYYSVAHWNAYFGALIYLRSPQKYPLQLILREILILNQTEEMGTNEVGMGEKILLAESIKYSVIVVSSMPVMLLYPF
ncbi:MAG TPA: carbohydrate ABC transporter permease, partial [Clostridia bacterium]|nr:carbohydrate ABC transporter permease [Clostridia bacterium]